MCKQDLEKKAAEMLLRLSVMTGNEEKMTLVVNTFESLLKTKKRVRKDDGTGYQGHCDFGGNTGILGGYM